MPLERISDVQLRIGYRYATGEGRIYKIVWRIGRLFVGMTDEQPKSIRLFSILGESGDMKLVQEMPD